MLITPNFIRRLRTSNQSDSIGRRLNIKIGVLSQFAISATPPAENFSSPFGELHLDIQIHRPSYQHSVGQIPIPESANGLQDRLASNDYPAEDSF
jgi:hypothetical protein